MATPVMHTPTTAETRIPAMPPPPGATSNFDHPVTLVSKNNIAMFIALPLFVTSFGLRCYVRLYRKRVWLLEDWMALLAWIGTVCHCSTGAATMAHYGGRHSWDITKEQAQEASYWFMVNSIIYGVAICTVKLTILCLYRRVFSPSRSGLFDASIVALMVLLVGFYTATCLAKIWQCVPREKIWITSLPGKCINISSLFDASGIVNTATDFGILLLPVKAVWNLNLKRRQKATVVLVFTFGISGPAFSLAALLVRLNGANNPDKSWVHPEIIIWALAELTAGVLCFSVPELGLLLRGKAKTGPSKSIVEPHQQNTGSTYLNRSDKNGKRQPHGFATVISSRVGRAGKSRGLGTMNSGTYYELDEREGLDVGHAQHQGADGNLEMPGQEGVVVTRDFSVETSAV
ncbi:hypothetical protein PG984_009886 [Apiospora sp. TS-2023a]